MNSNTTTQTTESVQCYMRIGRVGTTALSERSPLTKIDDSAGGGLICHCIVVSTGQSALLPINNARLREFSSSLLTAAVTRGAKKVYIHNITESPELLRDWEAACFSKGCFLHPGWILWPHWEDDAIQTWVKTWYFMRDEADLYTRFVLLYLLIWHQRGTPIYMAVGVPGELQEFFLSQRTRATYPGLMTVPQKTGREVPALEALRLWAAQSPPRLDSIDNTPYTREYSVSVSLTTLMCEAAKQLLERELTPSINMRFAAQEFQKEKYGGHLTSVNIAIQDAPIIVAFTHAPFDPLIPTVVLLFSMDGDKLITRARLLTGRDRMPDAMYTAYDLTVHRKMNWEGDHVNEVKLTVLHQISHIRVWISYGANRTGGLSWPIDQSLSANYGYDSRSNFAMSLASINVERTRETAPIASLFRTTNVTMLPALNSILKTTNDHVLSRGARGMRTVTPIFLMPNTYQKANEEISAFYGRDQDKTPQMNEATLLNNAMAGAANVPGFTVADFVSDRSYIPPIATNQLELLDYMSRDTRHNQRIILRPMNPRTYAPLLLLFERPRESTSPRGLFIYWFITQDVPIKKKQAEIYVYVLPAMNRLQYFKETLPFDGPSDPIIAIGFQHTNPVILFYESAALNSTGCHARPIAMPPGTFAEIQTLFVASTHLLGTYIANIRIEHNETPQALVYTARYPNTNALDVYNDDNYADTSHSARGRGTGTIRPTIDVIQATYLAN